MSKYINPAERIFTRYSVVISALLLAVILGGVIWVCYQKYVAATTADAASIKSDIPSSFDQKTIDEIKRYHKPTDTFDTSLPAGKRINPFAE
jgi:hypothetical protein